MKKNMLALCASFALFACGHHQKMQTTNTQPAFDKQGHRGCRGLMPENTIPAMLKAIDLGVTTLEMDVVISKDQQVVVSHDPYFNADITTTPEGKTLTKAEGAKILLYGLTYDSIARYDVGLKPHPVFPRQEKMAVHKPLLADVISASEAHARTKGIAPLWYNIETKSKPSGDGINHPAPEAFVDLLVAEIKKAGIAERTIIQSFDVRTLQVVHKKYPALQTALLMEPSDKRTLGEQLAELGFVPQIYSPGFALVNADLVKACHAKGMKVIPWTLNTKEQMDKAKADGVDGIISDYPDLF